MCKLCQKNIDYYNIMTTIEQNKPPDKLNCDDYKTQKIKLNKIIPQNNLENILKIINDAVLRVHKMTAHVYQLIRLYFLNCYNDPTNVKEPMIVDERFIDLCFRIFKKRKERSNQFKNQLHNELNELANKDYKCLNYSGDIDCKNLSHILKYSATEIVTSINNNIQAHFQKYIKKMIKHQLGDNKFIKNEKHDRTILSLVLSDIINNNEELLTPIEYQKHVLEIRDNVLVNKQYDIQQINEQPQKCLKGMIYICKYLEQNKIKKYQFCPLRTEYVPKHIKLDSAALVELFLKNKNSYFSCLNEKKEIIWSQVFNVSILNKMKNYSFDHQITTNGYDASILFVSNKQKEIMNKIKEKKSTALKTSRMNSKILKEELSKLSEKEQKDKLIKIEEEKDKIEKKKLISQKNKEAREKWKENKIKKEIIREYPRLIDLPESKKTELMTKSNNFVYVDPGRRSLLTMMNNDNKFLSLTNPQYLFETKRTKYQKKIEKEKKIKMCSNGNLLSSLEAELAKVDGKSCDYKAYQSYIFAKNGMMDVLQEAYTDDIYRKLKWYGYINKRKCQDKFMNTIEAVFTGKDMKVIHPSKNQRKEKRKKENKMNKNEKIIDEIKRKHRILRKKKNKKKNKEKKKMERELKRKGEILKKPIIMMGDWSMNSSGIKYISTPNKGLKRVVARRFEMYEIDEFRTSMLHYKTRERCEHKKVKVLDWRVKDENKEQKWVWEKLHAVLTYKNGTSIGCINRDKNACKNMKELTLHYLKEGEWIEKFKRGVKLDDKMVITDEVGQV